MFWLSFFGIVGLAFYFLLAAIEQGKNFNVKGNLLTGIAGFVIVLLASYFISSAVSGLKDPASWWVNWLLHATLCVGGFMFMFFVVRLFKIKKQSEQK